MHEAREDVKAASAELEAAIRTAARAGRDERFDQVLDDVISAALQRLMTANERLFVETEFADLGWMGFITMLVFIVEFVVGFWYIWKKGALDWE